MQDIKYILISLLLSISSNAFALYEVTRQEVTDSAANNKYKLTYTRQQVIRETFMNRTNGNEPAYFNTFNLFKPYSKVRLCNEVGIKFGITFNEYGWYHPDHFITSAYRHPKSSTFSLGFYGNFFKMKYFSTLIDLAFLMRDYSFEFNAVDSNGNLINVETIRNDCYLLSLSFSEKFEYNANEMRFYVYAGPRIDLIIGKTVKPNFQSIFDNLKSLLFGISTGAGISLVIGKNTKLLTELYYNPDITKAFESDYGFIKNAEYGIKLGFGFYF